METPTSPVRFIRHVGEELARDVDPAPLFCEALEGPPERDHET